jgi:gamma-glutamyltranspeptidase / glutathione hydrolase
VTGGVRDGAATAPGAIGRPPALATEAMVATSQPTATAAGLRILREGGNAADAVLAAAADLCVSEPMATGPGGDMFAIVFDRGKIDAIDGAGPAPGNPDGDLALERYGPRSVDVPGAVAGWQLLAERHGRLGLQVCLQDAIALAQRGFAVGARCAHSWATATNLPEGFETVPQRGDRVTLPELGDTLATIAREGPAGFYGGRIGDAICAATWLEPEDLEGFAASTLEPLAVEYEDHTVLELPPPTQGIAALEGLALLAHTGGTLADRITCCRLALEDAFREVRDGADVRGLIAPEAIARRVGEPARLITEPVGGTVYLCAVDSDGMAVSMVQSIFERFGSGITIPGTGVVMNNRCFGFAVNSEQAVPGHRPYHTIIPGMLLKQGELAGPFGVMGGFIQAQAHLQLVHGLLTEGLDPQTALDRPRFRLSGKRVLLERGLWESAGELGATGLEPVAGRDIYMFGGGQAILRTPAGTLIGGSDSRKDGYAGGW